MEPSFYRKNLDQGLNQVGRNQRFQRSRDKLCAQYIPYHHEYLAFPFQKVLRQFFLMDLGIGTEDYCRRHQFILLRSFRSFHCKLEQVVAFRNGAHRSSAFLVE